MHIFANREDYFEMTRLSVNINKIATLRNARGGSMPDVEKAALDCERFGAEGITVHPRPDERHIRYSDVRLIRPTLKVEFNIEGNPIPSFVSLVKEVVPDQVTLVPDALSAITSNNGWDTIANKDFLTDICKEFKDCGIRVSIFVNPDPEMVEGAAKCGADRVELYTAGYAEEYPLDRIARELIQYSLHFASGYFFERVSHYRHSEEEHRDSAEQRNYIAGFHLYVYFLSMSCMH